jgi:hypothetical protein
LPRNAALVVTVAVPFVAEFVQRSVYSAARLPMPVTRCDRSIIPASALTGILRTV